MDGAIVDLDAVEIEGKEIAEHLEPGSAGAGLRFGIVGGVDEVDFGVVDDDLADDFSLEDGVPLDGAFEFLAGEEGGGNVAGLFDEADVFDGVGAAPEVEIDVADAAFVEEVFGEGFIDIPADGPGEHGAGDGDEENEGEDCVEGDSEPEAAFARTFGGGFGRRRGGCLRGFGWMFVEGFAHWWRSHVGAGFLARLWG